jgi:hypothetical protein
MRLIRNLCVSSLLLLAGACATTGKYEAALNSWLGATETDLVSSWGPPIGVYSSPDGARILSYRSSGNMYLPGTPATYQTNVIGNTAYTSQIGGSPGMNIALQCATSFTVIQGRIASWRYEGNNCRSR